MRLRESFSPPGAPRPVRGAPTHAQVEDVAFCGFHCMVQKRVLGGAQLMAGVRLAARSGLVSGEVE
jgi:hypothetical protein